MRFAIRYETEYLYPHPVTDNLNALRVRPTTSLTQSCDGFDLEVSPEARIARRVDYFGTDVLEFGVFTPHTRLAIEMRARATTHAPADPPDPTWVALGERSYREAGGEFLLPASDQPPAGAIDGLLDAVRAPTPLQTVALVSEVIPARFEYRPGVTGVHSSVSDLLTAGAGVCQDFVQLALILLRRCGIAARYVSGYLFAAPGDGQAESDELDTHAWLEALLPDADGREPRWIGADPTNRGLAGEDHVKIGHGRCYDDVPPTKGVFRGGGEAELRVGVHMTRLDLTEQEKGASGAPAA
jgi:transglutaminase-like putative cysteine protease